MTTDIFKGLIMLNKTRYKALQHMRKRNNSLSEHSWSSCNPKGPDLSSILQSLCISMWTLHAGFFLLRVQTLHVTFLWCLLSGCVMFPIFLYSLWSFSTLTPSPWPVLGLVLLKFVSPPVNGEPFLSIVTNYLLKWDFWIKSANAPQGPFF